MMTTTFFSEIKIPYNTSIKPEPPVPGLKCGHDIAPITVRIKPGGALRSSQEAEHKVTSNGKDEKKAAFCTDSNVRWSDGTTSGIGNTKLCAMRIPIAVDFDTTGIRNTKFEIETIKSNKFM
jgi:hypothetical protein